MTTLVLDHIKLFAYHGCMDVEQAIGSFYEIRLSVDADLVRVQQTDDITDTVNYVYLNKIIHEEMKIVSKTLEHVGRRILDRIGLVSELIHHAKLSISKINPPVDGDLEKFTVLLQRNYI